MARNRASAKQAGAAFETAIAACLATHVDDRIERRRTNGTNDRGDLTGLKHMGGRVVVECKDSPSRTDLGGWVTEAETERVNDGATIGVVAHKRRGRGNPLDSYVTMTVADFIALLTGERPNAATTAPPRPQQATPGTQRHQAPERRPQALTGCEEHPLPID